MYANSQAKRAESADRACRADDDPVLRALADRFHALSDPTRLRLLDALREGERGAGELALASGAHPANVSRHLAVLRGQGLVAVRCRGRERVYRLADEAVLAWCDAACRALARREARASEEREAIQRVVQAPGGG